MFCQSGTLIVPVQGSLWPVGAGRKGVCQLVSLGLPRRLSGKGSACQCKRHRIHGFFEPRVRKSPWWRKWQPTSVFLPGKPHGQRCLVGCSPCGSQKSPIWLGNWAHIWFHSGLNRTTAQSWVLLTDYLVSIHKCGIFQGSWVHLSPDLTCLGRWVFQRFWPASGQWKKWIQSSIHLDQNWESHLPFMWYDMPSPTSLPSKLCSPGVLPMGINVNLFDFCSDYLYPYQSNYSCCACYQFTLFICRCLGCK